ncbi:MAG: OmpA family protein [Bryobacteraceae bacterium]
MGDFEDELEGSASGPHSRVEHLLRAGPATSGQKNTFRPAIYPIACWRIDDLRFEFDSSFIRPQARKEFRKLKVLRRDNPGAPLGVFGHADPTGADDYNKRLSGRRAQAVYAALVRDADLWEAIYSDPFLGDQWGNECIKTMLAALEYPDLKTFQQANTITPNGQNNRATRGKLFLAYMDFLCGDLKLEKGDFLAGGTDPKGKGKGDYQGCSEFNPVLLFSKQEAKDLEKDKAKRNEENAPNRRVMIFLFRKGSRINPEKWPCPRVSEGIAGCKKRWWSDGETRRSFQAERRKYADTEDTFACRFYDRLANGSPCEGGKAIALPTLRVYLKLVYLDPEKNERVFPPQLPVIVTDAAGERVEKVGAEGLLAFDFERARDWFTLRWVFADAYIATGAPDCKKEPKDRYIFGGEVQQAHEDRYFCFRLPKEWSLKQSDWPTMPALYNPKQFRFEGLSAFSALLGSEGAPAKMVLDPHWHFLRFEFFDRYYGHSDHGNKRISTPPLFAEGFRVAPAARGPVDEPDTRSNWWLNEGNAETQCQALPWIVQRTKDGAADAKPDAKIMLQLRHPAKTFVNSVDAATRKIEIVQDANRLKPSADRLKLYDLPELWKSTKYYTRPVKKFFDQLSNAEVQSSNDPSKPLTFCLDDIVLTDENRHQVTLPAADRVAIFFHEFSKNGPGKLSNTGVYEFDDGAKQSYYSKVNMPRRYYLAEYADWTRLVIAQGNTWDCFDGRTPDESPNEVVGARAAIRWLDHAPMHAANSEISTRPARTDRGSFYSILPYSSQFYADTRVKFDGSKGFDIGRNDQLVLRCCGRDAGNELFVNFHYFRYHFTWNPAVIEGTHPPATSKYAPATAANEGDRNEWADTLATGVADRWNGDDSHNAHRTKFAPVGNEMIRGTAVFFVQPVAAAARAHYTIDVVRVGPDDRVAWMNAGLGTGRLGDNQNTSKGDGWFTMAHESGHGDALPDEYNEIWDKFSYEVPSILCNLPGDPFIPDGAVPDGAMMKNNRRVRNRHLWHAAEFSRSVTGVNFKVQHGPYTEYHLPPHPQFPRRTYAYWPINHAMDAVSGAHGKYDLYLYATGPDRYTVDLLSKGPFDGILVIAVRIKWTFWFNNEANLKSLVAKLFRAVWAFFNWKWYATGKVRTGTPQAWEFKKCQILFSPRFLVTNNNTGKDGYDDVEDDPGTHFEIEVERSDPNAPNSRWDDDYELILECNTSGSWPSAAAPVSSDVQLENAFRSKFCAMLGLAENPAAVNEAALLPIVRRVITTDAAVHAL